MLSEKVAALLNEQVNKEFYSAYLYLDFSNYFEARGLDGFANWYKIQAQEERDHAMLFYQYLHNNNAKVTLGAIAQPDKVLDSDMAVLKAGLGWSTSSMSPALSTRSTPPLMRRRTSAPCSSWTGSSRSRARKKTTPTT